ncbi:hypothetical protein IAR50_002186 [Cryptococcus sp. DSM 104548]
MEMPLMCYGAVPNLPSLPQSSPTARTLKPLKEGRSISGTGALRIATGFLSSYFPGPKVIYLPNPTWGNHMSVGLKVEKYRSLTRRLWGWTLRV